MRPTILLLVVSVSLAACQKESRDGNRQHERTTRPAVVEVPSLRLTPGQTCSEIALRLKAADRTRFERACADAPFWVVACMSEPDPSERCRELQRDDSAGAYAKLREQLQAEPQLSSDHAHALFQAAAATGDVPTMLRINQKIGIMDQDGIPKKDVMEPFFDAHTDWAMKHADWIMDNATDPDKAKAWLAANDK